MSTQILPASAVKEASAEINEPFQNIALAFSGGGFRAASYALGVISYLQTVTINEEDKQTPLLQNVTYMSSASGGTIATTLYALYNVEGRSFGDFYKRLFEELEGVKLLDKVFELLNDDKVWKENKSKRRNIINAFALAYDALLFDHKKVANLAPEVSATHLQEVCFNTTEFYRGLLFRQAVKLQKDTEADEGFLYGNYIINLDKDAARELKLADLLAASSCFPAGFEPIIFPGDFGNGSNTTDFFLSHLTIEPQELNWKELSLLFDEGDVQKVVDELSKPLMITDLQETLKTLPLKKDFKAGFMDGGITDNQGLESMMRANERRIKRESSFTPFDLMLTNDVGSHYMDPYQPLDKTLTNNGLSIKAVRLICVIACIAGIAAIVYNLMYGGTLLWPKILGITGGIIATASGLVIAGLAWLKQFIKGKVESGAGLNLDRNFSPQITKMLLEYFGSTPLSIIMTMFRERAVSVLTLNSDVFLKRIRQLLYQRFFSGGEWRLKNKSNHVYDLAFTNDVNRMENDHNLFAPSCKMQLVAEAAFTMGTTLWFDENSKLTYKQASLVACGHFTTCYNLLLYIDCLQKSEAFNKLPDLYRKRVNDLYIQMNAHYELFKEDPFWLYNQLGKQYIPQWKDHVMGNTELPETFKGLR